MQIIGIIFNVFFLFILLLMMGFGFLFGMWRKLRSVGGLLIGVLLLIILINPIAKGIVNTELPFVEKSITGLVVEVISQEMASGAVIAEDGELALLCSSIALSAAKIIVLFVGMLVVFAVIVPLNLIIVRIVVGRDEHKKTLGMRFAGMGIAAAEVLLGFFLITLPIFGTTSLVMSYEDILRESEDTAEIIEVVEVVDNVIPNKITKIFGKKAPVNALGAFTKAKNKNGTINIYKEVYNAKPVLKVVLEADSKYDGDFLVAAINNKEELLEFIKNTNILETFMPAVLELLEANNSLEGIDIDELKKIDFATDKVYLADMLSVLFDFVEQTELDFDNPETILGNENLPNALKGLGESLKDTSFLDLLLGLLQDTLDEALTSSDDLGALKAILDVTKIEKQNLSSDLYQLGIIANSIYNVGILEENADLLAKPEELKKLINAVLDFSLVKGNESEIIDMLLEMSGLKSSLSELGINIKYDNIDWNEEKQNLINIVDAFINIHNNINDFDMSNLDEYLSDDTKRQYIFELINSLTKSSLIGEEFVIEVINNVVNGSSINVDLSSFDYDKIESWEREINAILELLDLIENNSLDITNMNKTELEELVMAASGEEDKPCYITSFLLGTIINNSLQEILSEESYQEFESTHDLTNPIVLRKSIDDIVAVITLANKLNVEQSVENWTSEEIEDFCNDFASLDLENSEVTTSVIQAVVNQTGAEITKEDILEADLEKEAAYLEEILIAIQTNQSETKIEELIKQAEEDEAVIILAFIEKFYEK